MRPINTEENGNFSNNQNKNLKEQNPVGLYSYYKILSEN